MAGGKRNAFPIPAATPGVSPLVLLLTMLDAICSTPTRPRRRRVMSCISRSFLPWIPYVVAVVDDVMADVAAAAASAAFDFHDLGKRERLTVAEIAPTPNVSRR